MKLFPILSAKRLPLPRIEYFLHLQWDSMLVEEEDSTNLNWAEDEDIIIRLIPIISSQDEKKGKAVVV